MSELIGEWLIMWIYIGIRSLFDWIKGLILGIPKSKVELKRLEKKWLRKKIFLTKDQENGLKKGTNGIVTDIIDKKNLFIEFYDQNGKLMELNDELGFVTGINQIKLKK